MGNCAQFEAVDPEVKRLAARVREQAAVSDNGWAKWTHVAQAHTGSTFYALSLSALAQLPENRPFFNATDKVVRLSDAGLELAACAEDQPQAPQGLGSDVAKAVRHYASHLTPIWLNVLNVSNVARVGRRFVQAVHVDLSEDNFPSETPVTYCPDGASSIYGRLVGQEPDGGVLYIAFDAPIGLPGNLRIDHAFLLTCLAEQLEKRPHASPLVKTFIGESRAAYISVAHANADKVARGLARLPTPWMRFLWGPPGAGKTYALGRLMQALLVSEPRSRILLAGPSNRAVDVALDQLLRLLEADGQEGLIQGRQILRYGYPRLQSIIERAEILGPVELDELSRNVRHLAEWLTRAAHEQAGDAELAVLRAELLAAQEAVKQAVRNHVAHCRVVATTTALTYLPSAPIADVDWDTVLVDEVTMVPPATCVFLGGLARERWLLAGDPRQLGPVFEDKPGSTEDDYEWLGKDVFDKSGISQGNAESRRIFFADARLAAITSQRRCTKSIWTHIQHLYPEIQSAVDEAKLAGLLALPPLPGKATVLPDVASNAEADQCRKMQRSWENPATADIALNLAYTLVTASAVTPSIAIIAPYRAQVKKLRRALRQQQRSEDTRYQSIDAGTVHQFQGSEADIVVFDLVDGPGRGRLGMLLRGDIGLRLVNVAVSRARGKLILIADRTWFKRTAQAGDNLLLWDLIMHSPVCPPPSRTAAVPQASESPTGKHRKRGAIRRG